MLSIRQLVVMARVGRSVDLAYIFEWYLTFDTVDLWC